MKWILAIDGGGTKTVACAGDLAGKVLGRVVVGPANYHITGLADFQALIGKIIAELGAICGLEDHDLALISLGLAGVDRPRDRELILTALKGLGLDCLYVVNNDAAIALVAGLGKAEGIALIAGTGSIAYGLTRDGNVIRAGGWGHIISDEGSGYDIGRQALVRGLKAWEGRDKSSVLLGMIMEYWKIIDLDGLIGLVYQSGKDKSAIAALTEVVAEAADRGDVVAQEILDDGAEALANLVRSVISRGFPGGQVVPLCCSGGVIQSIPRVRQKLTEKLTGEALPVFSGREAVLGALQLGYEYMMNDKESKMGR